jgi:hypothetical protein
MSRIAIGTQSRTRLSLPGRYSRTSLKSVDTTSVSSHCIDSGKWGSKEGVFLQARYAGRQGEKNTPLSQPRVLRLYPTGQSNAHYGLVGQSGNQYSGPANRPAPPWRDRCAGFAIRSDFSGRSGYPGSVPADSRLLSLWRSVADSFHRSVGVKEGTGLSRQWLFNLGWRYATSPHPNKRGLCRIT